MPDPLLRGYFGAISLAAAPAAAAAAACVSLDLGGAPLVVLARDWTGLWHFLTVQLLAAHRALAALGLDPAEPFRLLFIDRPGAGRCPALTYLVAGRGTRWTLLSLSAAGLGWAAQVRSHISWTRGKARRTVLAVSGAAGVKVTESGVQTHEGVQAVSASFA